LDVTSEHRYENIQVKLMKYVGCVFDQIFTRGIFSWLACRD